MARTATAKPKTPNFLTPQHLPIEDVEPAENSTTTTAAMHRQDKTLIKPYGELG
jgi:hypothetical protein